MGGEGTAGTWRREQGRVSARDPIASPEEARALSGVPPRSFHRWRSPLSAPSPVEEPPMLQTVAIVLIVLWALGLGTGYALGGLIHILLVIALISLILRFASGRKVV